MMLLRSFRTLAGFLLLALGTHAGAASPYFITVTGSPSITCTTTSFTIGAGLTASWNFKPGSAQNIVGSFYINGALINATDPSSLAGIPSPQAIPSISSSAPYTAAFPYTVKYVVMPVDTDTDGVAVSFNCNGPVGSGLSISNVPGLAPLLQASPPSIAFGSVPVGATTAPTSVTITNNGTADAAGVAVSSTSADFTLASNTCGATLAVNASCTIGVQFQPSAAGPRAGNVSVTRQGGAGVGISVTGTGVTSLSMPPAISLGSQAVGTTSAASVVTVTNTSGATVNVSGVTSSNASEFPVTTTCASVAAGATCTISVSFSPSTAGTRQSTVTVTSNGVGSPQTIAVSGTGTGVAPVGQLAVPASVTFGPQVVGTSSAGNVLTVTNTGTAGVNVASVTSSAPAEFAISANTCVTVAAGASCAITVVFSPTAAGARSATITVTSNGVGSPQVIAASGTGTAPAGSGVLSLPATLGFAAQSVGTTSAPGVVTLTNTGTAPVTVSGVALGNTTDFAIVSNSCTTVAVGASCTVSVTFSPKAAGVRTGSLTVTSNGTGSPQAVALSGTGTEAAGPGALALPATVDFGSVVTGTTGAAQSVVITNVGGAPVQVSTVASSNPSEFAITQSTCATVAPGATCTVTLAFAPSATGPRSGTLTVTSNGTGSPQATALAGLGVSSTPATVDIIEYYHAAFDHYFITGIADEIAKLDAGVFQGWARTGQKFKGYALDTPGSVNVCRFFSTSFAPKSSHFYTPFAVECAKVKTNADWSFEGEVFGIPIPDANGVCAAGTTPVYRYYNNGQGAAPNHRYTTDATLRATMLQRGWISEGYGDLGVIMCSPL
jgi:hypothetical protein